MRCLEDLTLVVLARAEGSQARAGSQLPAGVRQPSVVGVGSERLVLQADVIGPREELGVRALHVIALVERVDGDLPVGRQHGRQVGAEVQPVEVVRSQQRGQRVEEVEQRRGLGVETHPDEASPPVHAHRLQAGAFGNRVELVGIDHLDESAVEVVAPGVVATPDAAIRERPGPLGQPGPAMQARVVEGPDDIRGGADDQDRLVADQVLAELTDLRDLLFTAGHLPDAGPQAVEFEGCEFGARVAGARNGVVLADQHALEVHVAVLLRCSAGPGRPVARRLHARAHAPRDAPVAIALGCRSHAS